MVCHSLQAISEYRQFDWRQPLDFRAAFNARMFDARGQLTSRGHPEDREAWYTKRARLSSRIPLEYAYGAWGDLPPANPRHQREHELYRAATIASITALEERRLRPLSTSHAIAMATG